MGDELAVSGVEGRACEALAAFLADAPADDDVGVARFRTSKLPPPVVPTCPLPESPQPGTGTYIWSR